MGTSKSHAGPVSPDWSKAKGRATRWANSGGGPGVASVVAGAIAALAGRADGLLGTGGPQAGQRLGGLLSGLVQQDTDDALRDRGLGHLVGLTGVDLLLALIEYLAGDDEGGLERNAVRVASDAVAELLVERLDEPDHQWTEDEVSQLLIVFWTRYISQLVMQGLSESLLRASPSESVQRGQEIVDFVQAQLELRLTRHAILEVDWAGAEGAQIAQAIIDELIAILGEDT
jgi:hypothetical protein